MELPDEEQKSAARFLLAEMESDLQWSTILAKPESDGLLEYLAGEAILEHRAGQTRPLSLDEL